MKKLILLIIGIIAFAYQVTNTKTYTQKTEPADIETSISLQIRNKNLNDLLKNISEIINHSKNICEKSSYNFYPIYDKNGDFISYNANINSFCKFPKTKIKEFSKFLDEIKSKAKIKMNSIKLSPNDKEKQKILKNLRKKAYTEAQKDAEKLSNTLNKQCFVTQFRFNNQNPPIKIMYKTLSVKSMPLPKQKNDIYLKVFYKIECY